MTPELRACFVVHEYLFDWVPKVARLQVVHVPGMAILMCVPLHMVFILTGRVRPSAEVTPIESQSLPLSLNLFPHHHLQVDGDDR